MYRVPAENAALESTHERSPDLRPSTSAAPRSYWLIIPASILAMLCVLLFAGVELAPALVLVLLLAPLVATLVDRVVVAPRALHAFNRALNPALEALARGRHDEAETTFRTLFERFRGRGGLQATAMFNVAAVRAARGDYRGAIRLLTTLHAYPHTKRAVNIRARIPLTLALYCAQLGETSRAREWLDRARRENTKTRIYAGNVDAMILTREGKYAEAEAAYVREWPDLERVLSAAALRAIRAKRAFNLEKAGAPPEQVERLVMTARPDVAGELAHLGVEWDEMRAFLQRHDLA